MSIRRVNSGIQTNCKEDIYDLSIRFPKGFHYFFIPCKSSVNNNEESLCYIDDETMENSIAEVLHEEYSNLSFLIGSKGTGKSILLKHCLDMSANEIRIEKQTLYSTHFFYGYYQEKDEVFSIEKRILAINSRLESDFPRLSEYFHSKDGKEQFYKFVENTDIDILHYEKDGENEEVSRTKNRAVNMEKAREFRSSTYESLKLHFLLSSDLCPINRMVMCIDDIDELSQYQKEQIICSYIAFYKRLRSISYKEISKHYLINLLISITPDSYRNSSVKREQQNWPISNVLIKNSSLNLEKYFSKKIQCYAQKQHPQSLDAWKKCQQQFGRICQRFGGKYDTMIKNLTFNNIGESLKLYAKILCNQTWVKQGNRESRNDWFNPENYILNNISVIRAIACGENEIFVNDPEGYVSNLLYNKPDKDYSILCLYTIAFFMKRNNAIETYGREYCTLKDIIYAFKDIFLAFPDIESDAYEAIQYLYRHKVLRKSYKDIDKLEANSNQDRLIESSRLYLSSKGKELWNMFQSDSVLMEICREDYYRNYDDEGCHNNKYSSFLLMQNQQQNELLIDLCRIVSGLVDLENRYISYAKDNQTLTLIKEFFGDKMMCSYLMEGIKNSMEYSGLIRQTDVYEAYNNVVQKLYSL